jgi:hypothetical protein
MERQPCLISCAVVFVVAATAAHPHVKLSKTQSQNVLRSSCGVSDIFVDFHQIPFY